MGSHIAHDFLRSREQPAIVEDRIAHCDSTLAQLSRIAEEARGMSQCPHWNRAVVRGHAAEFISGKERGARTEFGRAHRGNNTCRSSPNHDDFHLRRGHGFHSSRHLLRAGARQSH
jgi:hypothetical protein